MSIDINHREALGFWLNRLNLFGSLEMAEIGCAHGGFAKTVLRQWTGERYWMIDPWAVQDKEVYKENQPTQEQYDQQFAECEELSKRDDRVRIIRDTSTEAAKQFKTSQLVCVYIDANHSYRSAMEDMDTPNVAEIRLGIVHNDGRFSANEFAKPHAVFRWAQ